jgi:hypothetical protein
LRYEKIFALILNFILVDYFPSSYPPEYRYFVEFIPDSYPLEPFLGFIMIIGFSIVLIFVSLKTFRAQKKLGRTIGEISYKKNKIKKAILELGTKFPRLLLSEIVEKTEEDEELILKTIQEMIESGEIYAEYFESSQLVAFNQQANIEEIDELMSTFTEWKEQGKDKNQKRL